MFNYSQYDILCIGIPKSGTNMTEKACRLIGVSPSPHMHTANYLLAEKHKVAYIYRNPRNVLISAQRYQNHQMREWENTINEEKLIAQFFDFFNASMPAVYNAYQKWFGTKAYCFKFEDMISDRSVIDGLAEYLGKPKPGNEVLKQLEGGTSTWTGRLSNWEDFWTPNLERIWIDEGMLEIEKRLGYL